MTWTVRETLDQSGPMGAKRLYEYAPEQDTSRAYVYNPAVDGDKSMVNFNVEQQGDLVSPYFDAVYLSKNTATHRTHVTNLPFLQKILDGFIKNPSDVSLLPNSTKIEK